MIKTLIYNKKKHNQDNVVKIHEYVYFYIRFYLYLLYVKFMQFFCSEDSMYTFVLKIFQTGGPVFVKIGQNVANKNNINKKLKEKLLILQENNYSDENNELIQHVDLIYKSNKPIAAGSIASVFEGEYQNQRCIVKIAHKNIVKKTILSINLFESVRKNFYGTNWFTAFNQLIEFEQIYAEILAQTDFTNEVRNLEKFRENFKDFKKLVILPQVFYYDNNVIIESYEEGDTYFVFIEKYKDKKDEASHLLHCCFYKMFFDNFIHADLHNSNIRFRLNDDNNVQIIILDFGLVSYITSQKLYADFINIYKKNIFVPDYNKFVSLLKEVNINETADLEKFAEKINEIEKKLNIKDGITDITNNKYIKKTDDSIENAVSKIMNAALESNMKYKDYIFNICNGFILLEDYRYRASEDKSTLHERFEYAEDNDFIENMKNSAGKMLKRK